MPFRAFPAPGVLEPSNLNTSGDVENGNIALHRTQFGPFEKLKDGSERVRCRRRKTCVLKQITGKTNQGRIKRSGNGMKFLWSGEAPPACCDLHL